MMGDWEAIARAYNPLKAGSIDGTDTFPHDRAVARAIGARYKPNKDVVGVAENTVFVGRLSPYTDEDMLHTLFEKFGDIERLRLVKDVVTGFSKCYAFIEFTEERDAYRAQKNMDKTVVDEKEIYVDFECERTLKGWVPRRMGGGLSGKKESGQLRFGGKNRPFKKPFKIDSFSKPEGDTFRDRLQVIESGGSKGRERRRDYYDESRERDRDSKYHSKDRSRRRSRSRDRDRHTRERSRSRERHTRERSRSRDREYKRRSRSRERERRRRE